jgi:hypothetical protein
MAKYLLRKQARELRQNGTSIKIIANELAVSKGTVSKWVADIPLSIEQIENLKKASLSGAEKGRIIISQLHMKRREDTLIEYRNKGKLMLNELSDREILIAGIALYWGEGGKKNKRIEFCNSDPKMIEFLICWLVKCFKVNVSELHCTLGINEIHRSREEIVKNYWSNLSGVPLSQFYKTRFKKTENKKIYANIDEHFGALSVGVRKSTKLYYEIIGLIEGLYMNKPG